MMIVSHVTEPYKCTELTLIFTSNFCTVQSQFTLLIELFDSKQPFYLKYGFPKVVSTATVSDSSSSSNDAHLQFLKDLKKGSYLN